MIELGLPRGLLLVTAIVLQSHVALAEDRPERCILRQDWTAGITSGPVAILGLTPLVSVPAEGTLKLHTESSDCCSSWRSPVGDLTSVAGPYDPASQRLYLWGFDENGWIEVAETAGTWIFGESGIIRPQLYYPANDIEDVTAIKRSAILGAEFYSGYTAPHWLTGSQSYRVYRIVGTEMARVPELETKSLVYVGDDLAANAAVFAPAGVSWINNSQVLVWYGQAGIITPAADLPSLKGLCQ